MPTRNLSQNNKKSPSIPTYKVAAIFNRPVRGGGGVAIYIKDNIPFEKLDLKINVSPIEVCAITLHMKNNIIALINCYDPPSNVNHATEIRKIFDNIPHQNYILVGDLNAQDMLWSPKQNPRGKTLSNIAQEYGAIIQSMRGRRPWQNPTYPPT